MMPRYYFNVYDRLDSVTGMDVMDDVGVVLAGPDQVQGHMMAIAHAWIDQEDNWQRHWVLEARDDEENIVLAMRFGLKSDDA